MLCNAVQQMEVFDLPGTEIGKSFTDQRDRNIEFLITSAYTNQTLAESVRSLQRILDQERSARALEREGYQRIAGTSTAQARHLADLNRAADRHIEELEKTARRGRRTRRV